MLFAVAVSEAGLEAIRYVELANWPRFLFGLPLGLFPASVLLFGVKTLLVEAQRCESYCGASAASGSIGKGAS